MHFEYIVIKKTGFFLDLQEKSPLGGNKAMTAAKTLRAPVRMTVHRQSDIM